MENVAEIQELVRDLDDHIDSLQDVLAPFLSKELTALEAGKDTSQQANLYMFLAYALNSVLFAYLKSTGVDTANHPIMRELDRVKSYMAKVKEQTGKPEKPDKSKRPQVDKEVANRFIRSVLTDSQKDSAEEPEARRPKKAKTAKPKSNQKTKSKSS